jgi:hypothetical protein
VSVQALTASLFIRDAFGNLVGDTNAAAGLSVMGDPGSGGQVWLRDVASEQHMTFHYLNTNVSTVGI